MKPRFVLAGALLTAGAVLAGPAQARHIDFFDAGDFDYGTDGAGLSGSQVITAGASGALGGQRDVALTGGSASLSVDDPDTIDDAVAAQAGTGGSMLSFDYGQGSDLDADFLNIPDGDGAQWTAVELVFANVTGDSGFSVTLTSGNGATAGWKGQVRDGRVFINYRAFLAMDPDLDLSDIDQASLNISSDEGAAYDLSFFARAGLARPAASAVPEPATTALLALGLLAVGATRRRQRR